MVGPLGALRAAVTSRLTSARTRAGLAFGAFFWMRLGVALIRTTAAMKSSGPTPAVLVRPVLLWPRAASLATVLRTPVSQRGLPTVATPFHAPPAETPAIHTRSAIKVMPPFASPLKTASIPMMRTARRSILA